MNALHATVLSTQCMRYAEVIEVFKEELKRDEKLSNQERDDIIPTLSHVVLTLKKLSNEIHNDH